ncbi:DUF6503 family protein [Neolewinella persica]|uniref:DUF6503 family protein n=1 Tax=Neolewinella persica TaxID=70998 RepID=UPI000360570B|nr:DUF6503 family protein [Neolewinella persica]
MLRLLLFCVTLILCLTACQPGETSSTTISETPFAPASAQEKTPAELVLDQALAAHSNGKYDQAHYQFVFRGKTYTFYNNGGQYTYTLTHEKDGSVLFDQLVNGEFTRQVDGSTVSLSVKETASGIEGLNSVIYFATLPHKLSDPAVNLQLSGTDTIKGQAYDVLDVNFNKEGGGVDHDDNFRYWINQETHRIDYLAYDYLTSGGGVRFRSAYNPRVVDGVLFQDYVNYKAPLGTPLSDLAAMFDNGDLEKLSVIATEEVVSIQ